MNNSDGQRYPYRHRFITPISFYNQTIYRHIEINFFLFTKNIFILYSQDKNIKITVFYY